MATIPSYVNEISFDDGDDVVKDSRPAQYKGTVKNTTDRISIAMRRKDGDGKPIMDKIGFVVVNTHYHPNLGYVICNNGYCCERMGAPKSRISTIVVQYPTDQEGVIDKPNLKKYRVMPWVFGADKFKDLKRINRSNPLTEKDLEVTCKDVQYQKLSLVPSGEAIWLKNEDLKADVLKKVAKLEEVLPDILGKKLTTEELREQLGDDTDGVENSTASEDYSEILNDL